jgi:hypothetical protein
MKAGQRAKHPVSLVSDWTLVTPLGQLTPRNLELARLLAEYRPKILEALANMPAEE